MQVNFTLSSDGNHGSAQIRLDEKEVRTLAGKLEGHAAVEYTVKTFVGMVRYAKKFSSCPRSQKVCF